MDLRISVRESEETGLGLKENKTRYATMSHEPLPLIVVLLVGTDGKTGKAIPSLIRAGLFVSPRCTVYNLLLVVFDLRLIFPGVRHRVFFLHLYRLDVFLREIGAYAPESAVNLCRRFMSTLIIVNFKQQRRRRYQQLIFLPRSTALTTSLINCPAFSLTS